MRNLLKLVLVSVFLASLIGCKSSTVNDFSGSKKMSHEVVTIRVTGIGQTSDEAIQNAFYQATQQVYGALTISERVVSTNDTNIGKNDSYRHIYSETVQEETFAYSKGFVESYEVIRGYISKKDDLFHVEVVVNVSSSKIGKRILYSSDDKQVAGGDIEKAIKDAKTQIITNKIRYYQIKGLFNHVVSEIPYSIFDVEVGGVQVERGVEKVAIVVRVETSLNSKVLKNICALGDELNEISPYDFYQNPHQEHKNMFIKVNDIYVCDGMYPIEREIFREVHQGLNQVGICIIGLNHDNKEVGSAFYPGVMNFAGRKVQDVSAMDYMDPRKTTLFPAGVWLKTDLSSHLNEDDFRRGIDRALKVLSRGFRALEGIVQKPPREFIYDQIEIHKNGWGNSYIHELILTEGSFDFKKINSFKARIKNIKSC